MSERWPDDIQYVWNTRVHCAWNHIRKRLQSICRLVQFWFGTLWYADGKTTILQQKQTWNSEEHYNEAGADSIMVIWLGSNFVGWLVPTRCKMTVNQAQKETRSQQRSSLDKGTSLLQKDRFYSPGLAEVEASLQLRSRTYKPPGIRHKPEQKHASRESYWRQGPIGQFLRFHLPEVL